MPSFIILWNIDVNRYWKWFHIGIDAKWFLVWFDYDDDDDDDDDDGDDDGDGDDDDDDDGDDDDDDDC